MAGWTPVRPPSTPRSARRTRRSVSTRRWSTVHGELDHLNTAVSRSYIVPKVATVDDRLELRAQTGEVERVFWVPLADFTRDGNYRTEHWGEPPLDRMLHFFELEDETVWGATARIIADLIARAVA